MSVRLWAEWHRPIQPSTCQLTRRPECETEGGWREIKWQDKWEIIFGHEIANMKYCPTPSFPVMCDSDAKPELFFLFLGRRRHRNQTEQRESRNYFYYIAKERRKREIYISFLRKFRRSVSSKSRWQWRLAEPHRRSKCSHISIKPER